MIDPVGNNFFDLPEYEHTQDETFPPLPPPGSPGSAEDALLNGDPEGDQLPQSKDSPVTARRGVKRTMPKLDAQRLISARGLPALCNLFDNVKFKGKGHEILQRRIAEIIRCKEPAQNSDGKPGCSWRPQIPDKGKNPRRALVEADLKALIRHMEHWAHRLFPQLQFENVVDKIESLGNKKPVQACLKKIRLDLPLLNEDFGGNEGEDEDRRLSPAAEESVFLPETQSTQSASDSPSLSPALTEEQQQRIERNRQKALERRQAKKQPSPSQSHASPTNEEYGTVATQEKEDACRDKSGVPFQATENMPSSVDQCVLSCVE